MKHNFLGVLILGTLFFGACNDDDNDSKTMTFNGENLTVSVSGMSRSSKEATLEGTTLTVKNAIPGESETSFTVENTGDKIVGTNSNANRDVTLDGTLANGKLDLSLTMDVKHKMANKWGVKGLLFNIDTDQTVFMEGETPEETMTVEEFKSLLTFGGALLPVIIPEIDLQKDGNISAKYATNIMDILSSETPIYATSPQGSALYNVANDNLYVALNLTTIMGDMENISLPTTFSLSRENLSTSLESIIASLENGLPLLMREVENGTEVYVTKAMMLPYVKTLPTLLALAGDSLGENKEAIIKLVTAVVKLIENSKSCELGLILSMEKKPFQQRHSYFLENYNPSHEYYKTIPTIYKTIRIQ